MAVFALFVFTGCPNNVLPIPKIGSQQQSGTPGTGGTILWGAPFDVVATHGLQGRIELSWGKVDAASRYYIYESNSPLSAEFTLCGETDSSKTSFVIDDCGYGADRYYRITAVRYTGEESAVSKTVHGTSLDKPIITDISEGDVSDNMSVVKWWMGNVSEDTYKKNVRYTIYCYKATGEEFAVEAVDGSKSDTEVTFKNLEASTEYFYAVEAFNIVETSQTEISAKVNATTARRLRPNPPLFPTPTRGTSDSEIKIAFTLPTWVERYDSIEKDFVRSPIFFKVFRKIDGSDEPYVKVGNDIRADSWKDQSGYETSGSGSTITDYYNPGQAIVWTDTSTLDKAPKRGVRYCYKIQSYTDFGTPTNYEGNTSESSYVETVAWLIDVPNFTLRSTENHYDYFYKTPYSSSETPDPNLQPAFYVHQKDVGSLGNTKIKDAIMMKESFEGKNVDGAPTTFEPGLYEELTGPLGKYFQPLFMTSGAKPGNYYTQKTIKTIVGLNLDFTDLEVNYKYVLGKERFDIDSPSVSKGTTYSKIFDSVASICNNYDAFDCSDSEQKGFYVYTLYIAKTDLSVASDVSTASNVYTSVKLSSRILVTDSADIPTAPVVTAHNGYKDYVYLTWTFDDTVSYSVYVSVDDGYSWSVKYDVSAMTPFLAGKNKGDTVDFKDPATSGYKAKYKVVANRAIDVDSNIVDAATLGTSNPEFSIAKIDYDSITVSWPKVSEADRYKIYYEYEHDRTINDTTAWLDPEDPGSNITYDSTSDVYSYKIQNPRKYDYASFSGKSVIVTVSSKNTTTTEETAGNVRAGTLGPANTDITVSCLSTAQKDKIIVTWKPVEGAKYYHVARAKMELAENPTVLAQTASDGYFISADGKTITNADEAGVSGITVKFENGQYVLYDTFKEDTDPANSGLWEHNQDFIAWGLPFRYTVFPVVKGDDVFNPVDRKLAGKFEVKELNKVSKIGSALGYGQDIRASKSEDPNKVIIKFKIPYKQGDTSSPQLKRRIAGSSDPWRATSAVQEVNGDFVDLLSDEARCKAFEYLVDYSGREKILASYEKDLKTKFESEVVAKDGGHYTEQKNKGYAFAVDFSTKYVTSGGYASYTEALILKPWDYSVRAVGPDNDFSFKIKNLNNKKDYIEICTMNHNGAIVPKDAATHKITVVKSGYGIRITPDFTKEGFNEYKDREVHTGILQVLRDYRHFAKVEAKRTFEENGESKTIKCSFSNLDSNGNEIELFTYRKISEAEFLRCVALVLGDSFAQCGVPSRGDVRKIQGATGNFTTRHKKQSGLKWGILEWGTDGTSYKHIFRGGLCSEQSGAFTCPFTITASNKNEEKTTNYGGGYLYRATKNTLNVTCVLADPSYNGVVSFEIGKFGEYDFNSCTMSKERPGMTSYSISWENNDYERLKYWAPFNLGAHYKGDVFAPDNTYLIYKENWWWR